MKKFLEKLLYPAIALYVKIVYVSDVWVEGDDSAKVTSVLDWCEKHKSKRFYKTAFYRKGLLWSLVSDLKKNEWEHSLKIYKEWKNLPTQVTYYNGWQIKKIENRYYCNNGKRFLIIN